MKLIFFFASIASALHYSVVLKNENALVIPYYAPLAEKIDVTFTIQSSNTDAQWGLEFGKDGQCKYDVDLMTLEQDGSKLEHGVFEATEEGQWYFRVCPNNFEKEHDIYGDLHVKGSNGYANAFDFNIVTYNMFISILYIFIILVWGIILAIRENVRSHHHMLTTMVLLSAATHWMTLLQLWQYNEYGYSTSDAWIYMELILQAVRNLVLVMYGMQTCSGWGMLYTEWNPLTYRQVGILILFFLSDLGSSIALELFLPNENTDLYLGILIFRHLFVLTAVCVYTTIKMDESTTNQEKISTESTVFYAKVSTLIIFILSTSCAILMSGLLYAKYEGNMYNFWLFQYGWIDVNMLTFLCGLLYLYRPNFKQNIFYKGMGIAIDSEGDSESMSVPFMFQDRKFLDHTEEELLV